jgi:hypothetical protein
MQPSFSYFCRTEYRVDFSSKEYLDGISIRVQTAILGISFSYHTENNMRTNSRQKSEIQSETGGLGDVIF